LKTDTDVSEKDAASVFRVEVCRIKNWLGDIGNVVMRSTGRGQRKELDPAQW
jgi:hypothetical protein